MISRFSRRGSSCERARMIEETSMLPEQKLHLEMRGLPRRCSSRTVATTGFRLKVEGSTVRSIRLSEAGRSEEHTSELQSLMRISYAVFCLKKNKTKND